MNYHTPPAISNAEQQTQDFIIIKRPKSASDLIMVDAVRRRITLPLSKNVKKRAKKTLNVMELM